MIRARKTAKKILGITGIPKESKDKAIQLVQFSFRLMCKRESRMYDDESAWHNKFYKEVTSKVDEDIILSLYTTEREDNRFGCPPERAVSM